MPRPRSAMRKIREVLRLSLAEGLSPRQVSASPGVPRITVRRFVERAKLAGLTWPLRDDIALHGQVAALVAVLFNEVLPDPLRAQSLVQPRCSMNA